MGRHQRSDSENLVKKITVMREGPAHMGWNEIGKTLNISSEAARGLYRYYRKRQNRRNEEEDLAAEQEVLREVSINENEKIVELKGPAEKVARITTLEQLLEFAHVDTTVWMVDRFVVNKWEGYRKDKEEDVTFTHGVMDGYIRDRGGLFIAPIIQIKAWLIRIKPVALMPAVSFVHITPHKYEPREKLGGDLNIALIVPDVHIGFFKQEQEMVPMHDRRAMDIVLQVASDYVIDKLILLGDVLDFPELTDKYRRAPVFEGMLQPSLDVAAQYLADLRYACGPETEIDYIVGNHEDRILKMVIDHLPQIYGIMGRKIKTEIWSLQNLLGLDELNIHLSDGYPDGEVWINDSLRCVHDAGLSAAKVVDNSDVNTIFGHNHRAERDTRTLYVRNKSHVITAVSPGFLGRVDGVIPGTKKRQNWSQGFAVVYYNDDGSTIVTVPINDGTAIFDNMLWKAD